MRKMLKNFFYGNIKPCEREMAPHSGLRRAADKVARCEQQLTERLGVRMMAECMDENDGDIREMADCGGGEG